MHCTFPTHGTPFSSTGPHLPSSRASETATPATTAAAAARKGGTGMCPAAQICVSGDAVAHTPTPCTTDAESSPLSVKYDRSSRLPRSPATWPCQAMAASASGRPAAMRLAFFAICGMVRKRKGTVAAPPRTSSPGSTSGASA